MFVDQALLANLVGMVDGATPEGTEGRLRIPSVVQPQTQLLQPFTRVPIGADIHRRSVIVDTEIAQAASEALSTTTLLRLANGLWQFEVWHGMITDVAQGVSRPHSKIRLVTPNTQAPTITMVYGRLVGEVQHARFSLGVRTRPSDTNEFIEFQLRLEATGASHTTNTFLTILANKIL